MEMPTVNDAAALIRAGVLSAEELTLGCLEAIGRQNDELNAFVYLDAEGAVASAQAVDAVVRSGRISELGPLAGVPFGVKDLEDCAGMPTTHGSRWYAEDPPKTADSIHIGRLRRAGAIPIGKTATPEFGAWAYTASPLLGVTRNPWDPTRTPGGSSGGSAAAVSSGMVPFATASDGGGSIRTPASFTGLVGLKNTYGRIPTFGSTHLSQNSVNGSLTTSVRDTALLLDVMAGPDNRDRTSLPAPPHSYLEAVDTTDLAGCRVTWSRDFGFAVVDDRVAALCHDAALQFASSIDTTLIERPIVLDDYIRTYAAIEGVDKFVGVERDLWEHHLDQLDPRAAPGWTAMRERTLPWAARVEDTRRQLVHEVAALFEDVDLIVTPMSSMPPFTAEGPMPTEIQGVEVHGGMSVVLAVLANLVNLPAISIPAGFVDGLPVGLQVIGPRFREDLLLAAAARYEARRPWPHHSRAQLGTDG
jgi:Asp-tRNA(Asn)/Glu-tRNA(Gln) amidotransferase A subunit family amidase